MRTPLRVVLLAVFASVVIWLAGSRQTMTADAMLKLPLPANATNVQTAVDRNLFGTLFGEYSGYLRFELPVDDVAQLISLRGMQPVIQTNHDPLGIFDNAVSGTTPVRQQVLQTRPVWWMPEQGTVFTLMRKSRLQGQREGTDFTWYIIDTSDPNKAIVYVYVREV